MINRVEKKNPKRRFKEFLGTGNWNVRTLGTVLMSMYNGQTPSRSKVEYWNGKINWLTSGELNCGIVNDTIEKITESGLDSANLKVIPKGILVIAITGLEASGTRGNCAILGCDTTLNQSCMALFPMRSIISSDFLFNWYLFIGDYYGIKYTQGTKQQSYNSQILNDLEIVMPSLDEQNKISSFFSKMDSMINLQQRKLDKLQATKKALLQEMFPEEGQDKPKRRFKGFTDAWEQRKFGELFILKSGVAFKLSEYTKTGIPIINGESIKAGKISLEKVNYLPSEYQYKYQECLLYPGDIVLGLNRPIIDGALKISRIPSAIKTSLLYQRAGKIIFKVNMEENFTYQLLSKEVLTFTRKEAVGSDQPFITTTKLNKWDLRFPVKDEERRKIGNLFDNINNIITLHQRKLDKLKNLKQAYLNEMFV